MQKHQSELSFVSNCVGSAIRAGAVKDSAQVIEWVQAAVLALGGLTPLMETARWDASDTRKCTEYRERILDQVNKGNDSALLEIMAELNVRTEFYSATWALLPKPIRDYLRNLK